MVRPMISFGIVQFNFHRLFSSISTKVREKRENRNVQPSASFQR